MSRSEETIRTQEAIIRLQSEAIGDLYLLLMQHIHAEDADMLPVNKKINMAAQLKADLDKEVRDELLGSA